MKDKKLKRTSKKFQIKSTCGDGLVIDVYRNSHEDGVLFENYLGVSRKDWIALVKWVNAEKSKC